MKNRTLKKLAIVAGAATTAVIVSVTPVAALAEKLEGPVIYGDLDNNISVTGAITAANGMDGDAQNNVGVIEGKVRTHGKVTNNIKVTGAITAGNGMNGRAVNNVGVITDKSTNGGDGGGGGGLLGGLWKGVKSLF